MFRNTTWLVVLTTVCALSTTVDAQRKKPPQPVPTSARDGAGGTEQLVVREQTVYVPYRKLRDVFESEGRGIFLPYEEFLKLWRAANPPPPPEVPTAPPAGAVIRSSPYVGSVDGDLARFTVNYRVESLKEGWTELSLPLRRVAIESVDLGESNAIFWAHGDSYSLLLPEKDAYEIKIQFSVPVSSAPGKKTLAFGIPPVAVTRVDLTIPEANARVDVKPASAAIRKPPSDDKTTLIVAHVGNSSEFAVSWMPPAGTATEDAAVLIAKQYASARLEERILALESQINYALARGEVAQFKVKVPTENDTRLLSVKGENIRRWNLEGDTLDVELHSPVKSSYTLTLAFERNVADGTASVEVPLPRMEGVLRETGWLALGHDPALRVTIDSQSGYSQLDPGEVPAGLRDGMRVGFQYLAPPEPLVLGVSKIEPVIRSRTVSVVTLGRERDDWVGYVDYTIAKAGVFSVALRVPERWSVEEVGEPASVDDFQSSEVADGLRTITVNLKSRQLGSFRLPFKLTADGTAATGMKTVWPPLVSDTVQDQGVFGVAAPRALNITTEDDVGMSSVESSVLAQSGILSQVSADAGEPQAYSYQKNGVDAALRARLDLQLEEKKEEVGVVAQHLVSVNDSGRISVTHYLDFEILYKARETLEFTAPSSLDTELRIDGEQIRETPQPVQQGDDLSKWTINLQSAVEGHVPLTITHEITPDTLVPGKPIPIEIPFVVPRSGVYKTRSGFVAITKVGNLEVQPTPGNLEVLDENRLTGKLRGGPVLAAYSYAAEEPKLVLELTRYKAVALARTTVNLLHVRAVMGEKPCKLLVVATMIVQNAGAQYLEIELPDGATTQSVHVAGQPVTTKQRGEGSGQLVSIPRSQGRNSFPVVVVYDQPLADSMGALGSQDLQMLRVEETPEAPVPVQKIELDLHLPHNFTYLSFAGDLRPSGQRETIRSRFSHLFSSAFGSSSNATPRVQPASLPTVNAQFDRTLEGTDLYTFSTMASDAKLRVRYISPSVFVFLEVFLFLAAALGGVLLVRKLGWSELWVIVGLTSGPLVIAWFIDSPAAGLFSAAFYGGLTLGLVVLARRASGRVGEWRKGRLALAPDPYLEDAATDPEPATVPEPEPESEPDTAGDPPDEKSSPTSEED